jgi:hypothetical protein
MAKACRPVVRLTCLAIPARRPPPHAWHLTCAALGQIGKHADNPDLPAGTHTLSPDRDTPYQAVTRARSLALVLAFPSLLPHGGDSGRMSCSGLWHEATAAREDSDVFRVGAPPEARAYGLLGL